MPSEQSPNPNDTLATEYRFDYRKAKPNRFASASGESQLKVVVLDDDVAQVFKTNECSRFYPN